MPKVVDKTINKIVSNIKNEKLKNTLVELFKPILTKEANLRGHIIPRMFLYYAGYKQSQIIRLFMSSEEDDFKKRQFDNSDIELILQGIYNAYMPGGNTYFHSLIANDDTKETLQILKKIKKEAAKRSIDLHSIIPFTSLDGLDCKKNFLMLAISKKYDSDYYSMISSYDNTKKEYKGYATKYKEDDEQLIKFLIENAPTDCITQQDSEGYNLIDYALMKMDVDILQWIIERATKDNIVKNLINESKIIIPLQNNSFDYKTAKQLIAKRYGAPTAIDEQKIWEEKRQNITEKILPKLKTTTISLEDFFQQIEKMNPQNLTLEIADIETAKKIINEKCEVSCLKRFFCSCSDEVGKKDRRRQILLNEISRIPNNVNNQLPTINLTRQQIQQMSGLE